MIAPPPPDAGGVTGGGVGGIAGGGVGGVTGGVAGGGVGAGADGGVTLVTVTVVDWEAVPPAPVQVKV